MTTFQVRSDAAERPLPNAILLDWFNGLGAGSTIQYEPNFLKGLAPSAVARDLFRLGGAVFCVDKLAHREETADHWTRDLELHVPVSDPALWEEAAPVLHECLDFLSGDRWSISFRALPRAKRATQETVCFEDAVSLFSGGLDSLAGAIDLLEDGRRLVLVGHHDSPLTDNRQVELSKALSAEYGSGRAVLRRLWLRPAPRDLRQARPLPGGEPENTTRARSFLFIAAGIAVADGISADTPLFVPENGFIGINVPLTGARVGSLSTRTTHPFFMDRMRALLQSVGLRHNVENPYRLLTKGEALQRSANPRLLSRLAPESISCSHPEHARLRHAEQGNCGYCYPCLIRRASMHCIGADDSDDYTWDVLSDPDYLRPDWDSGRSLRALLTSLGQRERQIDVLRNGRIPNGEAPAFFDVYRRGREELRTWLAAGAGPHLRPRLKRAAAP